MNETLSRRGVVLGGLVALGGLALGGCQSGPGRRASGVDLGPDTPMPSSPATTQPPATGFSVPAGVLPRSRWTSAAPILSLSNPMVRVERITIHHDGMPPVALRSSGAVASRLEVIRRGHVGRDWADIGYHFAVDPLGQVWEARPLNLQGAHVKDQNERNMGILVLGNFQEQQPTPAALAALERFVASEMTRFRVPLSRVRTHQELAATLCPGVNLQRALARSRSSGALARA